MNELCCPLQLTGDGLLTAVDVIGRAGESRVDHDVYGERGDGGSCYDAPDGKGGAKLIAAVVLAVLMIPPGTRDREPRVPPGATSVPAE
jgi:hypothetical protein